MRRTVVRRVVGLGVVALAIGLSGRTAIKAHDEDDRDGNDRHVFRPGNMVVSRSVYAGDAATVQVGQTLPPGCVAGTITLPVLGGGTTSVKVKCAKASADGTYPTVFGNDQVDGSFGVTSPIFLDQLRPDGALVSTLAVDPTRIVTSFSSKSELAVNLADNGESITFVGYAGGDASSPTAPNQLDVSNSNTPGVVDPTNPVVSQYYRAVAEIDRDGRLWITDGNAYSGNNGRAAAKARGHYFMAGNDNNGGLSASQLTTTQVGVNLITSTGAELLVPGQAPPVPPNISMIGDFEVTQVGYTKPDKPGKDNNFRGLRIFHDTLFVTKGSGGNGINTVYQVGEAGALRTLAPGTDLSTVPITILPGFPSSLASGVDQQGNPAPVAFPFGIWFANSHTLYVADEGDGTFVAPPVNGNVADAATQATAGLQKWILDPHTHNWHLAYTLQQGLNIGVPYSVANGPHGEVYPTNMNPAPGGLRNLTGRVNRDGTVDLWAITSTLSASGDQGADPNQLVFIRDRLENTSAEQAMHERFVVLRAAGHGEVLRGVSFTPGTHSQDNDDDDGGGRPELAAQSREGRSR